MADDNTSDCAVGGHPRPYLVDVDGLKLAEDIYGLLPLLSEEEYGLLKIDIRSRGVMVPVELDRNGKIIDGFYRVKACKELGIPKVLALRRRLLAGEQRIEHILRLHFGRRQFSNKEKKILAIKLRERGWTEIKIANNLGVRQQTISNWLKFTNFGELTVVKGKDGKIYPAKKSEPLKRNLEAPAKRDARFSWLPLHLGENTHQIKEYSLHLALTVWHWLINLYIRAKQRFMFVGNKVIFSEPKGKGNVKGFTSRNRTNQADQASPQDRQWEQWKHAINGSARHPDDPGGSTNQTYRALPR